MFTDLTPLEISALATAGAIAALMLGIAVFGTIRR